MSEREWTDEEALAAVREVCAAAGAKPYGEFPILGRAILTLRDENAELRAKVERMERVVEAAREVPRWLKTFGMTMMPAEKPWTDFMAAVDAYNAAEGK
jgi:sugar phosphate isomerase/epimerase